MIMSLFRKNTATNAVYAAYESIVAQSRQPVFYAEWGVPDTVTGRFDMISLHLALLFRRLRRAGQPAKDYAQAVFDLFFKDMDQSLREMGVSDMGVPKRIEKMGSLFYGLLASVNEAIDGGDRATLEAVLSRNVFADSPTADVKALTIYLESQSARLAMLPIDTLLAGQFGMGTAA
ncbi:MAG: ubiquinol-cytochrome chaperone [Devosia sp.]|nr:ubiquinol-cytochrome chaperone [Devosia sp.]